MGKKQEIIPQESRLEAVAEVVALAVTRRKKRLRAEKKRGKNACAANGT